MSIFFYKKLVQSNDDHTKYYRTIKIYYIFTRQTVRKLKSDCQITQKISKKMAEKPLKKRKIIKKIVKNTQEQMSFRTVWRGDKKWFRLQFIGELIK